MTVTAKHKQTKDPTSPMWLVWTGFFFLAVGGGIFYLLTSQLHLGENSNTPALILTLTIILAGISFISAWVNR